MRCVTFNVNSIVARLDFVLEYLSTRAPDVVCVQELKIDEGSFPRLALAQAGYKAVVWGQPQWNGVAIFFREGWLDGEEPALVQAGLPGQEDQGARFVTAIAKGIRFSSVYVPNGKTTTHPDFEKKLMFLDALTEHLRKTRVDGQAELVCGDFNLCPADVDSYGGARLRGTIFHTDDERARIRAILGIGFFDLFREKLPEEPGFSWYDYRAGSFHKREGLRIDLLLGSKELLARASEAHADRDYRKKREGRIPSDHLPVEIRFVDP